MWLLTQVETGPILLLCIIHSSNVVRGLQAVDLITKRNKRERFLSLANKRVNRAIKEISLVSNLSNRRNYEYTNEEAKKIVGALQVEIEKMRQSFKIEADRPPKKFEI
jgi:uncharacterized protein YeeX (DUF496 family)